MRYDISFKVGGAASEGSTASLRQAINKVRATAKPKRVHWNKKPRHVPKQDGSTLNAMWDGGEATITFRVFQKEEVKEAAKV